MRVVVRSLFARLSPFLLCLFLILFNKIPFHFLPNYAYGYLWCLIPIFYFAIYNPKLLSVWAVFILAVISDLFVQSPSGVIAFGYILTFFVANFFRKYFIEMTFWPLWGIFFSLLVGVEVVMYVLVCLLSATFVSFAPVLVEVWILTLVYPFLIRFCAYLDRKARELR